MSTPTAPQQLCVIVPMYNEEPNAEKAVRAICAVLSNHLPGSRLFAVDDGSKDRTGEILDSLRDPTRPLTVVRHEINQGYGAALKTGVRAASDAGFEFALFMDSDLTNDPVLIPKFAETLAGGNWDVVKASRYIKEGGMRGVPAYRQAVTILGNKVASKLFRMGIADCTNGFRAVRLSLIRDVPFVENGFPIILEELFELKKKKARATEIPYVLTSRDSSEGQSKFTYSTKVVLSYLKYALKAAVVSY